MFIPLHDANSLKHIKLQYITFAIIAANVIVYLMMSVAGENASQAAADRFGYVPAVVYDVAELPDNLAVIPEGFTYVSYSFLHANLIHLGGNMLFLWVFGDNVEDALGHFRFLLFYFACAAAGAALHGALAPGSELPLIGASGAIAGVVAAYLLLHPRVKLWVLAFGRIPLRIPAYIPLVLWILFQFVMLAAHGEDDISWSAHVGGIIAGVVLVLFIRRTGVPLFDRMIVTPEAVEPETATAPRPFQPVKGPRWGRS